LTSGGTGLSGVILRCELRRQYLPLPRAVIHQENATGASLPALTMHRRRNQLITSLDYSRLQMLRRAAITAPHWCQAIRQVHAVCRWLLKVRTCAENIASA
jgi:hypothetical protein